MKEKLIIVEKNKLIILLSVIVLLIAGVIIFDGYILWMTLVAIFVSGIVDFIFAKIRKYPLTLNVLVLPIIMVLLLPPNLPLFMVGVGAFFLSFFAKGVFGGDDKYIFHPSVAAVLFLLITFPAHMNTMWLDPIKNTITTGLPVANPAAFSLNDLFFGMVPGTVGTTFRLGIIVIGIILIISKVINWKIVIGYLVSFGLFTYIFSLIQGTDANILFSYMTGTILFAAIFLATDDPTTPDKPQSIWIYGLGLGLLTALIRDFATFPEGVIFAVIIMNAVAPLIDSFFIKEDGNE